MADIPHLAWPFRMGVRTLQTVEQDSLEDVRQNVASYLSTDRGGRLLSPEFGLEDPTFTGTLDPATVAGEIMEAEDRADVTVEVSGPTAEGRMAVDVHVELAE